ncbi:ribonuclease H2, subunit B [Suillus clintonianus]|uniref:ribonuclease H2, subunit B n=1 Tax=Suillus clintonianus TaxID=1904413 RepID=UPI001B85CB1B|nr:ribonuclease H2, subunit B [Suillus clintonianus]KAG2150542.1 ribonuclease H2, subunit B [Suillus clintonianus]
MSTHLAILPLDIIDALTARLNQENCHADYATRFLRLPHPRTGLASLFLLHDQHAQDDTIKTSSISEVQAISPANARTWFIGEEVIADGKLMVMTPMDPMFLLMYLLRVPQARDGSKGNFRPLQDIIEEVSATIADASEKEAQKDPSLKISADDIISFLSLDFVQSSIKRVCDIKVVTEEITVYRYSHDIVLENLKRKVGRLSDPRVAEMSRTLVRNLAKDGLMDDGKEELLESGRIKLACELLSQYLPRDVLQDLIASYDFSKLDAHLKTIRDEELALLAVAPDTRKRTKATKAVAAGDKNQKRKKDAKNTDADAAGDGDKKKKKDAKSSHGVEQLKKASVAGMSKLSTFFTKKTG